MKQHLATLALALVVAAGCGGDDGPTAPDPAPMTLAVTTGTQPPPRFIPASGEVAVGGTVTFTNASPVAHNVVPGAPGGWTGADLEPTESFSVTFPNAGVFPYRCTIHEGMTGFIEVVD